MDMDGAGITCVVDGRAVAIARPFDARDVLRLGGILGCGLVIRVDRGRASRFDPFEPVSFEQPTRPVFRTFRGAAHHLHVDGLRWDWGMPAISELNVREIGGIAPDLCIRVDGTMRFLAPAELIDLTAVPPPRLRSDRYPDRGSVCEPVSAADGRPFRVAWSTP